MSPTRTAPVRGRGLGRAGLGLGLLLCVLEQHSEGAGAAFRGEHGVRLRRVLDREPVRRELGRVDSPGSDQIDERLEVALLGPADVAGRKISTALLVVAVVASGAVRAGQPELDLLLVECRALRHDRDVADDDEATAVA